MAKILPKGKKVTGTKKKDKITWVSSKLWKKTLTVNAGAGNDVVNFKKSKYKNKLYGEAGNDKIYGGKNIDTIYGGAGNDLIYGYNGNDKIYGGSGKDTIYGGNGNDNITGGTGNDIISGGTGYNNMYFFSGNGSDTIISGSGVDTLIFKEKTNLSYYIDKNDIIIKYGSKDYITLKNYIKGHSVKWIKIGNKKEQFNPYKYPISYIKSKNIISYVDTDGSLWGTENNDVIVGNASATEIYANSGNDIIFGGNGDKTIYGGRGNDLIIAGSGRTKIYGDTGNDTLIGGEDINDFIFKEGCGQDTIYNYNGKYYIFYEGYYKDALKQGNDLIINFNKYNDSITIKDYFLNISLYDPYYNLNLDYGRYDESSYKLSEFVTAGNDNNNELSATYYTRYVFAGNGNDIIHDWNRNRGLGSCDIYAENGNDTIFGGYSDANIYGGQGNDYIISGQVGAQRLYGGEGNDIYESNNLNLDKYITLYDESGNSDEIKITDTNKTDLVLWFDIKIDCNGNIVENSSKNMYLTLTSDFGKSTQAIRVVDQFVKGHNIEKITTTADNYCITTSQINTLRENIAGWLHNNGFESVQQIIDSNNETNINNLIAEFQKADWQHV